jgi:hypothetical protein
MLSRIDHLRTCDTSSDRMAALRDAPPELVRSGRTFRRLSITSCGTGLEKNRDRRFQTARDIAFALSVASNPRVTTLHWLQPDTSPAHADRLPQSGMEADHTALSGISGADRRACSAKLWVGLAVPLAEGRRADAGKITDDMAARYPHGNLSAVDLADHYALTGSNGRRWHG